MAREGFGLSRATGEEGENGNVREFVRATRSAITLCFGISYLVNVFLASPVLDGVNTVLMVVVVVLSFLASTGSSRVIGAFLLGSGVVLLACAQAPFEVWKGALQENAYLIVMFIMVPLLSIPVQKGGYSDSLREVFGRCAHTSGRYYALVSALAALVGSLVSIAAVPLVYEVSRTSRHAEDARLLGTALSRGFATCMIWAPTSATIALVTQVTGVDWVGFFPAALACALAAWAVGVVMACVRERAGNDAKERADRSKGACVVGRVCRSEGAGASAGATPGAFAASGAFDAAKLVELAVFAFLLVASIMAVSYAAGLSVILAVALVSLVFPIIWMAAIKRLPVYARELKTTYCRTKLPQIKNQIILFAGAGLFAQSVSYSHVGDVLAKALLTFTGQDALLLTVAILALTLAASAVGVHPIAVIAVVGGVVSASSWGVSSVYFALVLSISWALGNVVCPASANVVAVADLMGESPLKASLRWSGPYVLVASVVLACALTLARAAGLV